MDIKVIWFHHTIHVHSWDHLPRTRKKKSKKLKAYVLHGTLQLLSLMSTVNCHVADIFCQQRPLCHIGSGVLVYQLKGNRRIQSGQGLYAGPRREAGDVRCPLSGSSELSFDSTLLSPLLFFCLVLVPFLTYLFLPDGPFSWTFSKKFFNIFFHEDVGFFVWLLFSS